MTKIDWAKWKSEHQGKEIDILTYSTPCQSISNAGKREGMKEGSDTRSAVLWYTENAIRELRPKFLLQENVKAIISQKNIDDLNSWKERVANLGYTNYCAIMNAKNYGVPQNRERFFMLSVRKDLTNIDGEPLCNYQFPKIQLLTRMVADLLDDECPTEYFLKPESVLKFLQYNEDKNETGIVYATIDHHLSLDEINGIRDKVLSECQE